MAESDQHCPRRTEVTPVPAKYKIKRSDMPEHTRGQGRCNQVVSKMTLGGVIELIGVWREDGEDDGFDPFLKVSVRDGGTFAKRSGIFKLANRRGPPGTPYEYLPSPQKKRKRNGEPFARNWYMRLVKTEPNEDSVEVRRKIVQSVCHFLKKAETTDRIRRMKEKRQNIENQGGSPPSPTNSSSVLENHYIVPEHWDLTPEHRQPLDHYVTDENVALAIKTSMNLDGQGAYESFATQYPADAACFFSGPPFCQLATVGFGYRNPYHFSTADDDYYASFAVGQDAHDASSSGETIPKHDDDYFGNCSD